MARIRHPGCHPSVTTVTTYHNHRQRVVMGVQRGQADTVHRDERSPLLAAERDRRGQPVRPDLRHRLNRHARLRRRGHGCRGMARNADKHTDRQHRGCGGPRAVQVTMRERRRRQLTLASSDGSNSLGSNGSTLLRSASSIAANSSRSSCDSRAGMPLSPPTALRHTGSRPGVLRIPAVRPTTAIPTRMRHPTSRTRHARIGHRRAASRAAIAASSRNSHLPWHVRYFVAGGRSERQ